MNAKMRTLVVGILVMVLLISSSPIQASGLPGANRTLSDSVAVDVTFGESVHAAPQVIYHVTGWLYTNGRNITVFLEKWENGTWQFKYSRTLAAAGPFGFYDLEYGKYRVRTFRSPAVYRYCVPSSFNAGHKTDGSDVRQYVECVS